MALVIPNKLISFSPRLFLMEINTDYDIVNNRVMIELIVKEVFHKTKIDLIIEL